MTSWTNEIRSRNASSAAQLKFTATSELDSSKVRTILRCASSWRIKASDSKNRRRFPLLYRGVNVGDFRPDLIVEDAVVVDVKSVVRFEPVFTAQMLTYLRLTHLKRGLILNFNSLVLKAGVKRVSL